MPMQKAGNQIALGEQLYFFTSPAPGTTTCLIWGHGGHLAGDGQYDVPSGVTVHFYTDHGQNRQSNPTDAILAGTNGQDAKISVAGPAKIPNYTVRKAVGKGWGNDEMTISYHDIERLMRTNQSSLAYGGKWCPHVVTVRRRLKLGGKTMQVGAIIDAVRAHDANITDFYYGGCRAEYGDKPALSLIIRAGIQLFK